MKRYYVYITTNQHRTVLYTGVTGFLQRRMDQHWYDALFEGMHFTGRYQSFYLIYFEEYNHPDTAIAREKEIKGWRREKKLKLIRSSNPTLEFLPTG
ncbi:GIY-YIG nuclease family protein [Polluticoccus soli]|uniref:GIY-YIG nuclease family protein n=1 Tax=Polluticoccus soli TaxID=3034150 RepID=UPI0023E2423F|nr:GIY-YIG nuclease family protein [Flavipsychrobacter sp. JY13-12]